MTELTGERLAAWAEKALSLEAKYWYGTCWQAAGEDLLQRKAKQYPSHYTADRMSTYRRHIAEKRMVCDCVGLIKGFFWTMDGTRGSVYQSGCPDVSANGMIQLCGKTGSIATLPEIRGALLWQNGHIGVYVGGGYAVEARGFRYGVVRTKVSSRTWTHWGLLPETMLSYGDEPPVREEPETPLLRKGDRGDAVRRMQELLLAWNPQALPVYGTDGEFGSETRDWVKKFQQEERIEVDGVVGPITWAHLKGGEA